jgi:hypothetical protein
MENRIESLAQIGALSRQTGHSVRLLPHDSVVKLSSTENTCSVLLRRVKAREFKYQTCFDSAELVLLVWRRNAAGYWIAEEPLRLPDPDFLPYRRQEIGEVRDTEPKVKERLAWEAMCHRPGNKTRLGQRDSFDRVWGDESPMERSWSEHKTVLFSSSSPDEA